MTIHAIKQLAEAALAKQTAVAASLATEKDNPQVNVIYHNTLGRIIAYQNIVDACRDMKIGINIDARCWQ